MKKLRAASFALLGLVLLSIFSLFSSFVSAQSWGLDFRQGSEQIIEGAIDIFEPFIQAILGGQDYTGLLVFERLLVFILLLAVIYISLAKVKIFEDYKAGLWIVAIIIPLIAVRYMNFEWFNTILLSYQVLGIAMLGVLPLIIYTLFLHNITTSRTLRKIGWVLFIIIYLGLWFSDETSGYAYIYFWTMVASLMLLLLDGTIRRYLAIQEIKDLDKENKEEYLRDIKRQRDKLRDDLKSNVVSTSEYEHVDRLLRKKLRALGKEYHLD